MPNSKPTIEQEAIRTLLREQFGKDISQLEPIQIGHMSQAYSFAVDDQNYILRFNPSSVSFEKDAYAYNHYASVSIPIPRIVTIGQVEEMAYALSEKLPGTMLNFMSDAEYRKVLPPMLEVLDAIHHIDVSHQQHYGYINTCGIGQSKSWRQSLQYPALADQEQVHPADFYDYLQSRLPDSLLEKSVFDIVYQKMLSLLDYCPEERYLLHGDYGFDNVLAHEGKITAVLDWALSQSGDFLYDAAYLHFFSYHYNFLELFREFYTGKNRSIPFYTERMICYTCSISLKVLKFFAVAQLRQEYTWARERILSLLANAPV